MCINLIGPCTIRSKSQESLLHCLTLIDPDTGWFEIAKIHNKSSHEGMDLLEWTWLTRYPKPMEIFMDCGTEFMAMAKDLLHHDYGTLRKNITTRNPQANLVECAHKTVHDLIASLDLQSKAHIDAHSGWHGILAAVAFAMCATVHTTT